MGHGTTQGMRRNAEEMRQKCGVPDGVTGAPTWLMLGSTGNFVYRIVGTDKGAEIFTYS